MFPDDLFLDESLPPGVPLKPPRGCEQARGVGKRSRNCWPAAALRLRRDRLFEPRDELQGEASTPDTREHRAIHTRAPGTKAPKRNSGHERRRANRVRKRTPAKASGKSQATRIHRAERRMATSKYAKRTRRSNKNTKNTQLLKKQDKRRKTEC